MAFDDALAQVACGTIVDAKTVVLLQYLRLRQLTGPHSDAG
jgi:hypothetical protein